MKKGKSNIERGTIFYTMREREREKEVKSKQGRVRGRVQKKRDSEKEKEKKSRRENHVINIGKSKMKTWRIEIMAHPLHSFSFKLLLHRDLHTTTPAVAHVHARKGGGEKERKRDEGREEVSEGLKVELERGNSRESEGRNFIQ